MTVLLAVPLKRTYPESMPVPAAAMTSAILPPPEGPVGWSHATRASTAAVTQTFAPIDPFFLSLCLLNRLVLAR